VGIEGHPSTATGVSIPVKSIYQDFVISGTMASRRTLSTSISARVAMTTSSTETPLFRG